MAIIRIEVIEDLSENDTVVNIKRVKFLGIPLYTYILESSNINYTSQFIPFNPNKDNDGQEISMNLYKKTTIGFKKEDNNVIQEEKETIQSEGFDKKDTTTSNSN